MTTWSVRGAAAAVAVVALTPVHAADIKVDLSKEQVGKAPTTFEPMVGTWVIAQDGGEKVVMVDGRPVRWMPNLRGSLAVYRFDRAAPVT